MASTRTKQRQSPAPAQQISKCPTGISGFDEITGGGLPRGRPSLVCGGPGCGKTLFGVEFLVRGALEFGEPGVLVSFEERAAELTQNVASLGFSLPELIRKKLLAIDHVRVERSEIEETGEYDLEALFIRLGHAIDSVGAKRVVLDTIESLFAGLSNEAVLRAELRRLFAWLKDRGVTAVITGERGEGQLTRQGLEEYVSDCVILMDHRVRGQVSTRRMRVVKYRGSAHGTNEYPFLIDTTGLVVMPITSMGLNHRSSSERAGTGVAGLDVMLGGRGFFRGSSVLLTGTAGSGKSSFSIAFAAAACRRGERCLYFAFEESPHQIVRNMRSIGIDLDPLIKAGRLRIMAARPTLLGLETHLATMHKEIRDFRPEAVVVDPITSLMAAGAMEDVGPMVLRLVDLIKGHGTTAVFTSLTEGGQEATRTEIGISSMMDTWILLQEVETAGERRRGVYILKSRGMAHSHSVREFQITDRGIRFAEPAGGAARGPGSDGRARRRRPRPAANGEALRGARRSR